MSIGLYEVAFLVLISVFVAVAVAVTKGEWMWLAGIPVCVAIAVVVTPADPGSTFLVATPFAIGYTILSVRRERATTKRAESG